MRLCVTHTDGGHIYLQVNACLCLFPFSVELLMWPAARVQFACRGAFVCVCVVLFFFLSATGAPFASTFIPLLRLAF